MKKTISLLIISILLISSCSQKTDKDEEITSLNKKIEKLTTQIKDMDKKEETRKKVDILREKPDEEKDYEKVKQELEEKEELISKLKTQVKSLIIEKSEKEKQEEKIEIPKEKILDIKFYAQAINGNFDPPYQEFCEEASILNGYYYLTGKEPSLNDYNKDLRTMKKYEDKNFKLGYRHTSLKESKELLEAFQGENQKIFAEIIEKPTIEIIKENIAKGNPVMIPAYGKGLGNIHFTGGGATYHNFLIKGYKNNVFITNEVGTSRGNSYEYNQKLVIDNNFDYDPKLFPNRFREGKKQIMILYKK